MLTVEKTTPIPVLNLLLTFPQYNNPPGSWFMGLPTLRVSTLLLGLWAYPPFGSQSYSSGRFYRFLHFAGCIAEHFYQYLQYLKPWTLLPITHPAAPNINNPKHQSFSLYEPTLPTILLSLYHIPHRLNSRYILPWSFSLHFSLTAYLALSNLSHIGIYILRI